jgi:hypothetical protein
VKAKFKNEEKNNSIRLADVLGHKIQGSFDTRYKHDSWRDMFRKIIEWTRRIMLLQFVSLWVLQSLRFCTYAAIVLSQINHTTTGLSSRF